MKKVLEGSEAVAEAVRLCEPGVIATYPITPQTHIVETLAKMIADGELDSEMIRTESEHSSMSVCVGAQATGVRSYTSTASQGLALMHEIVFIAASMRLPIVMSVANRALSGNLNIWNDEQDSFAERDSGWIQLYVENVQEAFDTHIQAFKIAEEIGLPVMVCLDGFFVSHVYENAELLTKEQVKKFLPAYKPKLVLDPNKPVTMGTWASPEYYMPLRKQLQDAVLGSVGTIKKVNEEFGKSFGRKCGNGLVETANLEGKKHALITIGSVTGTVRTLLEKEGIGLIKIRCLRPFPKKDLVEACKGLESIGVLEKDISLGANGALYDEVRSALYGSGSKTKVSNFIIGLGGKDVTQDDLRKIIKDVKSGEEGVTWQN